MIAIFLLLINLIPSPRFSIEKRGLRINLAMACNLIEVEEIATGKPRNDIQVYMYIIAEFSCSYLFHFN